MKETENIKVKKALLTAFNKAQITPNGIKSCKELSHKIFHITNLKISPSTLYRILNIERYKIKPYNYTIAAINTFNDLEEGLSKHYFDYERYKNENRTSPLENLLRLSLQNYNTNSINPFLNTLPLKYAELGIKQLEISHVFGFYFRENKDNPQAMFMLDTLIKNKQFLLYYFETFPDFDYLDEGYLMTLKRAIVYHKFREKIFDRYEDQSKYDFRQAIFLQSIYIHYCLLLHKQDEILDFGKGVFNHAKLCEDILIHLKSDFTLISRFLSSRLIFAKSSGHKGDGNIAQILKDWQKCYEKLSALEEELNFGTVIIADTLLRLDLPMERIRFAFNDHKKAILTIDQYEPASTRYLEYYKMMNPQQSKALNIVTTNENYIAGFYELNHHSKLLSKIKALQF